MPCRHCPMPHPRRCIIHFLGRGTPRAQTATSLGGRRRRTQGWTGNEVLLAVLSQAHPVFTINLAAKRRNSTETKPNGSLPINPSLNGRQADQACPLPCFD